MNETDTGSSEQPVSEELLRLLVCPIDHADLKVEGMSLVCTKCGRRYPVEDGIPNMLVDA